MTSPPRAAGFTITPSIASDLLRIEAARSLVDQTPLSPAAEAELRFRARVRSSHFSTHIEGNRLTLEEAGAVIADRQAEIPGRARDVSEVRNYCDALLCVEERAMMMRPLSDIMIRRFHRFAMKGDALDPTPFRKTQISILSQFDGILFYYPPNPEDLEELVSALVTWAEDAWTKGMSPLLLAGIVHHEFAAIFPFDEGNERCSHLIDRFILHRGGYGLKGLLSIEAELAQDTKRYSRELNCPPSCSYYEGRKEVDVTSWLEYFVSSLADGFEMALLEAKSCNLEDPEALFRLDHHKKSLLCCVLRKETITAPEAARELHLSEYMARKLLRTLMDDGWLQVTEPSRRVREYGLSVKYRQCIGNASGVMKDEP